MCTAKFGVFFIERVETQWIYRKQSSRNEFQTRIPHIEADVMSGILSHIHIYFQDLYIKRLASLVYALQFKFKYIYIHIYYI